MRIAISNIAWDVSEDEAVASLLQEHRVDAIDIAPENTSPSQRAPALRPFSTFVTSGHAAVSSSLACNRCCLARRDSICLEPPLRARPCSRGLPPSPGSAASWAQRLVFGSPKNRDRGDLGDEAVLDVAVPFFRELGDVAGSHGVTFCLEPNPTCYGANFMTDSEETARIVRLVDHPAICMQFDTGSLAINGEDPSAILRKHGGLVGHVHASEPQLVPLGDGTTDHRAMSAAVETWLPQHVVSIEMVATAQEPHLQSIRRALATTLRWYCPHAREPRA